jgi:hypothetical protein
MGEGEKDFHCFFVGAAHGVSIGTRYKANLQPSNLGYVLTKAPKLR